MRIMKSVIVATATNTTTTPMEKPFSDVRRKRHDASASRAGLHGRSGQYDSLNGSLDEGMQRCVHLAVALRANVIICRV